MRGARILGESKAVDDEIRALDKLVERRRSIAGRANTALAAACSMARARVALALPLAFVFWVDLAAETGRCFAGRRLAACRGRGRRGRRVARTVRKRLFLLLRQ